MEREGVWRGRWYGEGGGMEREVVLVISYLVPT
jgi:hypothetical protein